MLLYVGLWKNRIKSYRAIQTDDVFLLMAHHDSTSPNNAGSQRIKQFLDIFDIYGKIIYIFIYICTGASSL